jgi:xanthine/uracil permease
MEAIGDIAASAEASRVAVDGPEFDSRIQGGVLADGVGGFFSALFTNAPLSIFAQNNGVVCGKKPPRYCLKALIPLCTLDCYYSLRQPDCR